MDNCNILTMPLFENELNDQDIVNLFMGLVRLIRRQYQSRIDDLVTQLEQVIKPGPVR